MVYEYKDCEMCKYFDLHPFIREGDWTNYCDKTDKAIVNELDICEYFEEEVVE